VRILLVIAACAALTASALASATTPRLMTLTRTTFTVRGVGFVAKEHVRVVATTDGRSVTKWATTGSLGGFTVALPTFTVESCNGFVLRAFGAAGDRATLHRLPPECPQPPTP
jgi:hypothetical protein